MAVFLISLIVCLGGWRPSSADFTLEKAVDLFQFGAFSDTSCSPLVDPDHGYYHYYRNDKGQQECKLKCKEGYLMPFTQYYPGKRLPFHERGKYTCIKKRGMNIAWYPIEEFDCVEIVYPTAIQQYFYLKLPVSPAACDSKQTDMYQERFRVFAQVESKTSKLCMTANTLCSWEVLATCVHSVWAVDVILSYPFSKEKLVAWPTQINREMLKDIPSFKVDQQTGGQTKKGRRALVIVCPAGTRISQDFLCHGCSPGYYIEESLMECQPCPKRYYQDEAGKTVCKRCPSGTPGSSTGGKHIASCYSFVELTQRTDLLTATAVLTTVMTVVSVLLAYRYRIQDEVEPSDQEPAFLTADTFHHKEIEGSNRAVNSFAMDSLAELDHEGKRQEPEAQEATIPLKVKAPPVNPRMDSEGLGQQNRQALLREVEKTDAAAKDESTDSSESRRRPRTHFKQGHS